MIADGPEDNRQEAEVVACVACRPELAPQAHEFIQFALGNGRRPKTSTLDQSTLPTDEI